MPDAVLDLCSLVDELSRLDELKFDVVVDIVRYVRQGRKCLAIENDRLKKQTESRSGIIKEAWSPSRLLKDHLKEAIEKPSSISGELLTFGTAQAVIVFFMICSDNRDRKSPNYPLNKIKTWPRVMRKVLAILLWRLETNPQMTAFFGIQNCHIEYKDEMAADEQEGCKVLAQLGEVIKRLSLLFCANDNMGYDERDSRKRSRTEPPIGVDPQLPSQTRGLVVSRLGTPMINAPGHVQQIPSELPQPSTSPSQESVVNPQTTTPGDVDKDDEIKKFVLTAKELFDSCSKYNGKKRCHVNRISSKAESAVRMDSRLEKLELGVIPILLGDTSTDSAPWFNSAKTFHTQWDTTYNYLLDLLKPDTVLEVTRLTSSPMTTCLMPDGEGILLIPISVFRAVWKYVLKGREDPGVGIQPGPAIVLNNGANVYRSTT